ncbi:MAG: hypothetical protein Q9160_000043 [Pyrenula sp. 1 TL-2023]
MTSGRSESFQEWAFKAFFMAVADAKSIEETKQKAVAVLRKLDEQDRRKLEPSQAGQLPRREDLELTQYESAVATDLISPDDIPVSFEDIGGLDDIIEELKESVIYPLTMPELYGGSSLLSAPSGVLLFGPPGCGKTMLAKALAHESGASFINLHISTITEKWYGDSNKLVTAVFSLARKLQPTIVFIDEIDAVLGTRRSGEHEANSMVKAEFMTHWDGLKSANSRGEPQRILVMGATNRFNDIDAAILRRMPKKFLVPLPSEPQRYRILSLVLKDTLVDRANFDADSLVRMMAGFSGSDIKEACRDAAMVPVRRLIHARRSMRQPMVQNDARKVRGLRTEDFFSHVGGRTKLIGDVTRATSNTQKPMPSSPEKPEQEISPVEEAEWSTDSSDSGEKQKTYKD